MVALKAALADFFVIDRPFATIGRIKREAADRIDTASPSDLEALLFFSTPKQQSWLVASADRIVCIVDKRDEKAPTVVWSVGHDEALSSLKTELHSPRNGTVTIAGKRPRLFSRKLFADQPLEYRLRAMVERARERASAPPSPHNP